MIKHKQLVYFCILSTLMACVFIAGCTEQSWATYVDSSDGIKISHPANWEVIISKSPSVTESSTSNIVHIYTPDGNGVIQIMGFSDPTMIYTSDKISDEAYNELVNDFHQGQDGLTPTSIKTDETSYMFNGNPARHLQIALYIENKPMTSDVYIVRHDKTYYTLSYLVIEPSAQQYSETATAIMKTFKTVEWGK